MIKNVNELFTALKLYIKLRKNVAKLLNKSDKLQSKIDCLEEEKYDIKHEIKDYLKTIDLPVDEYM